MKKYALEYDPESDAAYVRLFEHKDDRIRETVEFDEGMQADLDKDGNIIGIEILHFSKRKVGLNELIAKGIENIQIVK
ncbi:MAG: DUF2283 domain-containing protein [Nitrososphaerales archaeon]